MRVCDDKAAVGLALCLISFVFGCGSSASGERVRLQQEVGYIVGGSDASACDWPSVAFLGDCTATLVHPRLLLYAAHCGENYTTAMLSGQSVRIERCESFDDWGYGQGNDLAFCLLSEANYDVPFVPIALECEFQQAAGSSVVVVGYGKDELGVSGVKRSAAMKTMQAGLELLVGGSGVDICNGDSGGPALVQVQGSGVRDSWRVAAVASYSLSDGCGGGSYFAPAYPSLPWLEAASGLDLSPCADDNGRWDPTPLCGGFPEGVTAQTRGTCGGTFSSAEATCGAPFDAREFAGTIGVSLVERAGQSGQLVFEATVPDARLIQSVDFDISSPLQRFSFHDETFPFVVQQALPMGEWSVLARATGFVDQTAAASKTIRVVPGDQSADRKQSGDACAAYQNRHGDGLLSGAFGFAFSAIALVGRRTRKAQFGTSRASN